MLPGGGNPLSLKFLAFIEFEKYYNDCYMGKIKFININLPNIILNYFLKHTGNEILLKNILLKKKNI